MENSKALGWPPGPASCASCSRTHASAGARLCRWICGWAGQAGRAGRPAGRAREQYHQQSGGHGGVTAVLWPRAPNRKGSHTHLLQHCVHAGIGPLELLSPRHPRLLHKQLPNLKQPLVEQVLRYDLQAEGQVCQIRMCECAGSRRKAGQGKALALGGLGGALGEAAGGNSSPCVLCPWAPACLVQGLLVGWPVLPVGLGDVLGEGALNNL